METKVLRFNEYLDSVDENGRLRIENDEVKSKLLATESKLRAAESTLEFMETFLECWQQGRQTP